jgi:SAM-dependent methyltransferase
MIAKRLLARTFRPRGRVSFLSRLGSTPKILDVGCADLSPFIVRQAVPLCQYTGIDVCDYRDRPDRSDRYIIVEPEAFADGIRALANSFDAVLSAHNLEHCNDRDETLEAMLAALKPGGRIYISFPCEASVHYPRRTGTLNYFDDPEHKSSPPDFAKVLEGLKRRNFEILFAAARYRPLLPWMVGLVFEPLSALRRKTLRGTWELYGFESIIWAQKPATAMP